MALADVLGADWEDRYAAWRREAAPLLRERRWNEAYRAYPWLRFTETPFTPLARPLRACQVALITSGGLSVPPEAPFDETAAEGDPGWRILPDTPLTRWAIDHGHYDPSGARSDYNAVFPADALRSLARDGLVGGSAAMHVSFHGYQPNPAPLLDRAVPAWLDLFQAEAVDAVVLVPV